MSFAFSAPGSRKRKAEDDEPQPNDRMSTSPSRSPQPAARASIPSRQFKRAKAGPVGRPLALPRLLETLDAESLRGVLQSICTRHPSIGLDVERTAPRPSVASSLAVLQRYENDLQSEFPFGGDPTSDYAYNRVRQALINLLDALTEFTPHFLPPNEPQATQSLAFLDSATEIIHRLPDWSTFQNTLHKQNAYEEISRAWTLVIREAAKKAGGVHLQYDGWNQRLSSHNQQSNGKLQAAVDELSLHIGWLNGQTQQGPSPHQRGEVTSIRQELLSGTYGANLPVRVGPW